MIDDKIAPCFSLSITADTRTKYYDNRDVFWTYGKRSSRKKESKVGNADPLIGTEQKHVKHEIE